MKYDAKPTPVHYVTADSVSDAVEPVWYAVHTKNQLERMVYDTLQRKGFSVYLPMETKRIRPQNRPQVVSRPLFSRYLFVAIDPVRPLFAEVRKTHGVEWVVCNADKPVPIKTEVIEALRVGEEAGMFDHTKPKEKVKLPAPGDKMRVLEGPFAGLIGEIASAPSERRIFIMLHLLGQPVKTKTTLSNLQRAV